MNTRRLVVACLGLVPVLFGCAATPAGQGGVVAATQVASAPEQDRRAILAMAGEYKVTFDFSENLALAPGYELHKPHVTGGNELVIVLEDSPKRIVLQHLLVGARGHVTKHWRQDWEYQQTEFWAYTGDYAWSRRTVSPEASRGQWVQTVWQVDDSPRYAALGRWEHDHGLSRWTSEPTSRPLPRREHTTRSDYDVLISVNRHTITPSGWAHEQDSYKLNRAGAKGAQMLAHEVGNNTYAKVSDFDFTPAREYWDRTQKYWALVRAYWSQAFARHDSLQLHWPTEDDDNDRIHYMAILIQANDLSLQAQTPQQVTAAIEAVLKPLLTVDGAVQRLALPAP